MTEVTPVKIERQKIILGEGADEKAVFEKLLRTARITDIQVLQYGGKNKLEAFLKALVGFPGFKSATRILITQDADDNAQTAFKAVQRALRKANFEIPQSIGHWAGRRQQVRVHIIPSAKAPGCLETIFLDGIGTDSVLPHTNGYVDTAESLLTARQNWGRSRKDKARLYAWLATRDEPAMRLRDAQVDKELSFTHAGVASLLDIFRQV